MHVHRSLGLHNPFSSFGSIPHFDGEEDPAKAPPAAPQKETSKTTKEVPIGSVVFASQDDVDRMVSERVERAKVTAAEAAATAEAEKQGNFQKIVEEQFNPLKTKVETVYEPELEKWRTLASAEITTLKATLSDELKELMPTGLPLADQLDWLRKAAKANKSKPGHSPEDPDPKGGSATAKLEALKKQMGLNPSYRT